jgi:propanol-preferring alcohol dehydrogenase
VANLTRRDGQEFMAIASAAGVHTETEQFSLEDANEALDRLRSGKLHGAAVIVPHRASGADL